MLVYANALKLEGSEAFDVAEPLGERNWRYAMWPFPPAPLPQAGEGSSDTPSPCFSPSPETGEGRGEGRPLGGEDIQHMPSGTVAKTFIDDTQPGGPVERTVEYLAPFFKPDREADYRRAWAFFAQSA